MTLHPRHFADSLFNNTNTLEFSLATMINILVFIYLLRFLRGKHRGRSECVGIILKHGKAESRKALKYLFFFFSFSSSFPSLRDRISLCCPAGLELQGASHPLTLASQIAGTTGELGSQACTTTLGLKWKSEYE